MCDTIICDSIKLIGLGHTFHSDYSCAVESKILLHGRMYITDKFICFYSNFFGFEKKVRSVNTTTRCIPRILFT